MLWLKKNSYQEFNSEKNSRGSKIPLPHNFSNGRSLISGISLSVTLDDILVLNI